MSTPKRKPPAFQLYADDFLAGTADMTPEEVGIYIRLLCHQWAKGGIPNDPERAGRMAGLMGSPMGSPCLGYVLDKFSPCDDGMLRNDRLEKIRQEMEAHRAHQSISGAKGAEKRWKTPKPDGNPNGVAMATPLATPMAKAWPDDSSPSPSPSPKNIYTQPSASPWVVAFGIEMPEKLQTQPCLDAVKLWLGYKKERKEAYKAIGLKSALTKWANEFTPDAFPSAVDHSIANGWKGIFPINGQTNGNRYQPALVAKHPPGDWRNDPNDWRHSL